ncbi:hypothetical protein ACFW5V_28490 [Streptomyces sp. NPDC058762]|uniref:hypothetical protein n=1 Tax=Streptomyces sp. NPDC058762 TaxID=3346629 RepID=UPI00367FADEC
MRVLRISMTDGEVGPCGEYTDREEHDRSQFWGQWNSPMTMHYWHRTELDRNGSPYTIKWYSNAFRNGRGVGVSLTAAMEAEGNHPADTRPQPQPHTDDVQPIPATQRGRANHGERLCSPQGTWTVAESWVAVKLGCQGKDRDYQAPFISGGTHVFYLLTHEDGHQEEWSAPGMTKAGFHRILPEQQQALI